MPESGYINYFEILGLGENTAPGEVRKTYKRKMKSLIGEIARTAITVERRAHFLLEIAKLNAAAYILRDRDKRDAYWEQRKDLIALEQRWCEAARQPDGESDQLRREFDAKVRYFLSRYVEETMLEAGRDKEIFEASHWDPDHERHAFRILRHYRHGLHHDILERLPYHEVTEPSIDWTEREAAVAAALSGTDA